jgi:DNA polymerase-3 subunit beta
LASDKSYPIDLTISDNGIVLTDPDDKGQTEIAADTSGEGFVRVNGSYLAGVLKAGKGMVDFSLTDAYSPMLFSSNGYRVVVMPMITDKANEQEKAGRKARGKPGKAKNRKLKLNQ